MFFETIQAADLEQELQDISSNPHLAKPTGNRGQSLPVVLPSNPPAGKAAPLQAELQQWMSNGSLDQLHAACHKVVLAAAKVKSYQPAYNSLRHAQSLMGGM